MLKSFEMRELDASKENPGEMEGLSLVENELDFTDQRHRAEIGPAESESEYFSARDELPATPTDSEDHGPVDSETKSPPLLAVTEVKESPACARLLSAAEPVERQPVPKSEPGLETSPKLRLDSGAGLTVVTGYFNRCHSCRRSTNALALKCSRCSRPFCSRCLKLRHGEDLLEESAPGLQWVCPICRSGCGPGCEKSCCTCSPCRQEERRSISSERHIRDAQSAGFNLHDFFIHLNTGESKQEIANRKQSRAWTVAGCKFQTSNVTADKMSDGCPGDEKVAQKRRDRSDNVRFEVIEAGETMAYRRKIGLVRRRKNDATCRSDKPVYNWSKKRRTMSGREVCHKKVQAKVEAMEIKHEDLGQGDESYFSANEEVDWMARTAEIQAFTGALATLGNMTVNLYLLSLWFDRQIFCRGNQMWIVMSDKEVQLRRAIMARSHAEEIAHQFHPAQFQKLPRKVQDSLKSYLRVTLRNELADSKTRLEAFYREIDAVITESLPKARRDVHRAIERTTKVVEQDADDMLCDMVNLGPPAVSHGMGGQNTIIRDIVRHIVNLERCSLPIDIDVPNMVTAIACDILNQEGQALPDQEAAYHVQDRSNPNTFELEDWQLQGRGLGKEEVQTKGSIDRKPAARGGSSLHGFGEMVVGICLLRQWFSREKHLMGNRMSITLTHREEKLLSVISRITHMFILGRLTCRARPGVSNEFRGKSSVRSLRVIDALITKALPVAKRDAELALEQITEALESSVDAISCKT